MGKICKLDDWSRHTCNPVLYWVYGAILANLQCRTLKLGRLIFLQETHLWTKEDISPVPRCFALNYIIKVVWSRGHIISTWMRWLNKRGKRQFFASQTFKMYTASTWSMFQSYRYPAYLFLNLNVCLGTWVFLEHSRSGGWWFSLSAIECSISWKMRHLLV